MLTAERIMRNYFGYKAIIDQNMKETKDAGFKADYERMLVDLEMTAKTVYSIMSEYERIRTALVCHASRLAKHMERLSRGLKERSNYSVNSSGEVQSEGLTVDLLCAQLSTSEQALKDVLNLVKSGQFNLLLDDSI